MKKTVLPQFFLVLILCLSALGSLAIGSIFPLVIALAGIAIGFTFIKVSLWLRRVRYERRLARLRAIGDPNPAKTTHRVRIHWHLFNPDRHPDTVATFRQKLAQQNPDLAQKTTRTDPNE